MVNQKLLGYLMDLVLMCLYMLKRDPFLEMHFLQFAFFGTCVEDMYTSSVLIFLVFVMTEIDVLKSIH